MVPLGKALAAEEADAPLAAVTKWRSAWHLQPSTDGGCESLNRAMAGDEDVMGGRRKPFTRESYQTLPNAPLPFPGIPSLAVGNHGKPDSSSTSQGDVP